MKHINHRKRTFVLSAILIATFLFTQAFAQAPCSDLFISELMLSKNPSLDGDAQSEHPFDLNYAVEIFNPTQSPVNLVDYSLELTTGTGITSIPLNGVIPGGNVYVVCNPAAGINLQIMADTMTPYLDFETSTILTLKHNNTVIDKIGQDGIPTADSFDVVQFLVDPYGYLASVHLDVNDFQNIDMRRGMSVTAGDASFTSATDLVGNWALYSDNDLSDIGHYTGVCNKAAQTDIFGYNAASYTVSALNTSDPLGILCNGVLNGPPTNYNSYLQMDEILIGSNTKIAPYTSCTTNVSLLWGGYNASLQLSTSPPCSTAVFNYSTGLHANLSSTWTSTTGNTCKLVLSAVSSGTTIDPARNTHYVYINRQSTGVNNTSLNQELFLFPTAAYEEINVKSSDACAYTICDVIGRKYLSGAVSPGKNLVKILALPSGTYTISFVSQKDGRMTAKKFSKL